jgi:glutamine synthetase
MSKIHLEYLWLDGSYPQQIRSKTKIINSEKNKKNRDELYEKSKKDLSILHIWNFDGSSTGQATTDKSELLLKPVNVFLDPFKYNGVLVLCEVYNTDMTPHESNTRHTLVKTASEKDQDTRYGFEMEYFIFDKNTKKPVGWPEAAGSFPAKQGDYYCGVGTNDGRELVDEHTSICENIGLEISGVNAEVCLGQWEYQIGPVPAIDGSDQLWISRYILQRLAEDHNYYINFDPKPYPGNEWNGSGMHVNMSTAKMRKDLKNKYNLVVEACKKLALKHVEHIEVYGIHNELRLTGANETCGINQFRYGVGDRTASIRIPSSIHDKTTPGYLEDRRPASNGDPYEICNILIETICGKEKTTYGKPLKKISNEKIES